MGRRSRSVGRDLELHDPSARGQQIVRFDRETREPITKQVLSQLLERLPERLRASDAAILEDSGKGLLVPAAIRKIIASCIRANVPVSADSKSELRPFKGAALLKPNLREAEHLSGVSAAEEGVSTGSPRSFWGVGNAELVITRGGLGMSLFTSGEPRCDVATSNQEVFDVQGAGDTTIAVLALARAAGESLVEAAVLANAAAGVVVEKIGTATARRDEIAARLPAALAAAREGFA